MGADFTSASTVLFDDLVVNSFFRDSSTIQVQLDISISGVPQTHTVQVSNSAGASNVLMYDVYAPQQGPLSFTGQPSLATCQNIAGEGTLADVNGDGLSDLITFSPQNGNNPTQLSSAARLCLRGEGP
jgi:hypothetical protein